MKRNRASCTCFEMVFLAETKKTINKINYLLRL